jgi:hypothetical protein
MTYTYPNFTGYHWNAEQRCTNEVGVTPLYSEQPVIYGVRNLSLHFDRELTPAEKTKLDTLMASNPGYPPTEAANTVYTLKDIWETRNEFSTVLGNLPFFIYYNESNPGVSGFDRIQLHFKKGLSQAEKNKVKDEHSKLMSLKSN